MNSSAELVFIPMPGAGHLGSAVETAKLLVNRDRRLSITVLIMKLPFDAGRTTHMTENAVERIRFVNLPRDESIDLNPSSKHPMALMFEIIGSQAKYVRDVVGDILTRPGSGRLAAFVVDMFCTALMDVANEFRVPTYVFFASGAAFLGFKLHIQSLCDDHNQDVNEFKNTQTELPVPTFANPVPVKVFPDILHDKEGSSFAISSARGVRQAKGILVNTFLELEPHAVKSLSAPNIPPVYAIGPVVDLENHRSGNDIMHWLDNQPPSSVVFLCFGSFGNFNKVQVKEIADALEHSGLRFMWSLRQPIPPGQSTTVPAKYDDSREVLPEGFLERTAGVGKVIGWAPQVAVLSHPAVGGFVSHCGWNSILESLWCGVPIATWPIYAEQQLNAFLMVVELELEVEIKLDYVNNLFRKEDTQTITVTAEEIERGIRSLMDSQNEIKKKVKEMSQKSRMAIMEGGSSYNSLGHAIEEIMDNISS